MNEFSQALAPMRARCAMLVLKETERKTRKPKRTERSAKLKKSLEVKKLAGDTNKL